MKDDFTVSQFLPWSYTLSVVILDSTGLIGVSLLLFVAMDKGL